MPDYIYLLENRLSPDQRHAIRILREAAAEAGMILFLTGDVVRDLTSGHAVRDIEVAVHGNALKLKKIIEKSGGKIWGEDEPSKALYLCFPGTVRVDLVSTHRIEYPKPGKPVYHPASIQEDLRCRDFTANAMAISLNEGSFGLLMDPLNGAADIEARTLRLVSNYGFLEDPALLIRATRYKTRLGWELDPRTQARFENAKAENVIEHLSALSRSEELEQIGHEEDGLKVLEAMEAEGWMKILFPAWTPAKADVDGLRALHELAVELLVQGVHADMSAAQMQLLTDRLAPKDLAALKKSMLRPGFVEEWNSLDSLAVGFAKALSAKENQTPSAGFKLFMSYDPEAVLWLGFTTKDAGVRERYNLFLKVWPETRQRIPHALMQELRITPELQTYSQIVDSIFLELLDGKLSTPEEMRAFLEPHSPPAPPPQVTIKRSRAKRGAEAKIKEPAFDEEEEEVEGEEGVEDEDIDLGGEEEEEIDLGLPIPKGDLEAGVAEEGDSEEEGEAEEAEAGLEEESEEEEPQSRRGAKAGGTAKVAKERAPAQAKAEKTSREPKPEPKPVKAAAQPPVKLAPAASAAKAKHPAPEPPKKAKPEPAKKHAAPEKSRNVHPAKPLAKRAPAKAHPKTREKPAAAKAHAKPAPAKHASQSAKAAKPHKPVKTSKPATKKPAAKSAKKR